MQRWMAWFWLAMRLVAGSPTVPGPTSLEDVPSKQHTKRTDGGLHVPIVQSRTPRALTSRGLHGLIGLGDYLDVTYNVLLTVGGITTPLMLDTGSSDLWVISDACKTGCSPNVPLYPQNTFQSVGLEARLQYGDSATGTHAYGLIGKDTVTLAGLSVSEQYFAAINDTNTTVSQTGSAGILGLGFPVNSVLWNKVFADEHSQTRRLDDARRALMPLPLFPSTNLLRSTFPDLSRFRSRPSSSVATKTQPRKTMISSDILQSYNQQGPLLSRLVSMNKLTQPMFAVTLQRDTIEVGGNVGMLSIGDFPKSVHRDNLTWVSLRAYSPDEGGLSPPDDSPGELYPITWEVIIDDVYFDGERLPRSQLSLPNISVSALIDTGNSVIRGPADVVQYIITKLGRGQYPCAQPHTIAFQIGGKMFPVDPRDFGYPVLEGNADICTPNILATDPPVVGGYLFSWSLGTPFLKGVFSAFHYGDLTYPSRDPPRIGLLSTVPSNADEKLRDAVADAVRNNGEFPGLTDLAPTGAPTATSTNANGIPQTTLAVDFNGSTRRRPSFTVILFAGGICTLMTAFI